MEWCISFQNLSGVFWGSASWRPCCTMRMMRNSIASAKSVQVLSGSLLSLFSVGSTLLDSWEPELSLLFDIAILLFVDCHACRSSAMMDSAVSMSNEMLSVPALSTSVRTSHQASSFLSDRTARLYRSIFFPISENSVQQMMAPANEVTMTTKFAKLRCDKIALPAVQHKTTDRNAQRARLYTGKRSW